MKFLNKHFKTIVIVGLVLFIVFLLKECNGEKNKNKEIELKSARLEQQRKADSIQFSRQVTRWQDSIYNAGLNSDMQAKVIKEAEKKLQASQRDINRLTAIIRNAPSKPDSSFVLVSPNYKDACDSLPNKIDSQNVVIADLKQDKDDLIDLMNYEVVYRDSLIEAEQEQIGKLNNAIVGKNKIIQDAIKSGQPRGRFLIGAGNLFLPDRIFNPHFVAAYQAKNGKQFQGKVGQVNAQQYYEGTVLITIFK